MLSVVICTKHLTLHFYHVTCAFSEFNLYRYQNVRELLARSRRDIGSLSDSNEILSENYLFRKRTLNDLAKLI